MNERPDPDRDPALDELARLLDRAAAQEARERRESDELAHAPGLDDVERTLAGAWGERRRPRGGPYALFAVVSLVAAAALLYLLLRPQARPEPRGPSGELLNQGTASVRCTPGPTPGAHTIDWSQAPAGTYRLRVLDLEHEGAELIPWRTIAATRLEISAEESALWPANLLIELEVRRADGTKETLSAEVELRR